MLVQQLYQTIGRLYIELYKMKEARDIHMKLFDSAKEQRNELQEKLYKLRDVDWDNVRLRQLVDKLGGKTTSKPAQPAEEN